MSELTQDEKITIEIEHAEAAIANQKGMVAKYHETLRNIVNGDPIVNIGVMKVYLQKLERTIRQLETNEDTLDLLVYLSATEEEGD